MRLPIGGSVLDVGSYDVNGSYRPLWTGWRYVGVDVSAGPNVDAVVPPDGSWDLRELFDVVISGQALEHCEDPFALTAAIGRHLKPAGYVCIIVPAKWPEHRYPVDCWRFLPDGLRVLMRRIDCEVVRVALNDVQADCADAVVVGRKRPVTSS